MKHQTLSACLTLLLLPVTFPAHAERHRDVSDCEFYVDETLISQGKRTTESDTFKVTFEREWNRYGWDTATRTVHEFTYFVTVTENNDTTTYWLKNNGANFQAWTINPSRYPYSTPVCLGGYTTGEYLWRDSGSPLFVARNVCSAR
jgi:hypothetical protein